MARTGGAPRTVRLVSSVVPRAAETELERMLTQAESDLERAVEALERIARVPMTEDDMRRAARSALRGMDFHGMT